MQVAQVVEVVFVARRCAHKGAFIAMSSPQESQEDAVENSTENGTNDVSKSRTTENSEDVARLDVMAALEQQTVELQTMHERVKVLEEQMQLVHKELFHDTGVSEEVILPLEGDGSKGSASETTTQGIRSEIVVENEENFLQGACHKCSKHERLSTCARCKERFCRTCQYWCSRKWWGCGLKLCGTCNKEVASVEIIYKAKSFWWCGKCHVKWSNEGYT